jgi:hypothetical protein
MLSTEFDNGFGGASSSFSFAAQRLEQSFEIADVDPGRDMRGFNRARDRLVNQLLSTAKIAEQPVCVG